MSLNDTLNGLNSTQLGIYCASAELYVLNPVAIVARAGQILLSLTTFVLFLRMVRARRKAVGSKMFHGNFTILFHNMLLVCLLYCVGALFLQLRYLILYVIRTNSCDLMTPLWYAIVARLPGYVHLVGLPMLHFAIMCERVRATLFSRFYERMGLSFSVMELTIIWSISLLFSGFIVSTVLTDLNWEMILIYASLVSKYNAALVIVLQYVLLMLVLLTVGVDFWVVVHNRQQQKNNFDQSLRYNLSQKYQVNENALSMRLMLPLDLSFAAIFLLYLAISTVVRTLVASNSISMTTFEAVYDWLFCLNMQHGIISFWLYSQFINQMRMSRDKKKGDIIKVKPIGHNTETDAHFKQLRAQWA